MKRTRRLLALGAAVAALSLAATGCDSSPYAASVNSVVIKQAALRTQMRELASSRVFVTGYDQAASQQRSSGIGGVAPGTFSANFAAGVLQSMVEAAVVHQHLAAVHRTAPADAYAAARGVLEIAGGGWLGFPAALRQQLVQDRAERAAIEPVPSDLSVERQIFAQDQAFFFQRVCTRQITVSVPGPSGGIDFPASLARARSVVAQDYSGTTSTTSTTSTASTTSTTSVPATTSPTSSTSETSSTSTTSSTSATSSTSTSAAGGQAAGGAVLCYSPEELEDQGAATFATVLGLAPGQATAPQRTSYGYQILAVDSRVLLPFSPAVGGVLAVSLSSSQDVVVFQRAMSLARVKINPAFGSWDRSQLSIALSSVPDELNAKLQAAGT